MKAIELVLIEVYERGLNDGFLTGERSEEASVLTDPLDYAYSRGYECGVALYECGVALAREPKNGG